LESKALALGGQKKTAHPTLTTLTGVQSFSLSKNVGGQTAHPTLTEIAQTPSVERSNRVNSLMVLSKRHFILLDNSEHRVRPAHH
jgi:hypothetical protein